MVTSMPLTFSFLSNSSCSFPSFLFLLPTILLPVVVPDVPALWKLMLRFARASLATAAVATVQMFGFGGDGVARSS